MNRSTWIGIALIAVVAVAATALLFLNQQQRSFAPAPQTPKAPFPYLVEDIVVDNPGQGVVLGGTMTVPFGDGPFAAVVLLSVAGPNDRDQSFAGHRGFHVLADRLTRQNIAVARFDDRSVGASSGDYFAASWTDLASDARAMIAHLGADARIDAARIGLLGMSQGAAVAALAASGNDDVAFLVLLSAPGLPGEQALTLQFEKTLAVSGIEGADARSYRELFAEFLDIMRDDPAAATTRERLRDFVGGPGRALVPAYRFVPRNTDGIVEMLLSPWYRSNFDFDPAAAYGRLSLPVLALGGTLDFVAPPDAHLVRIASILDEAPTSNVVTRTMPHLNHLFQEATTGLPAEYATLQSSFSPAALDEIAEWIASRTAVR